MEIIKDELETVKKYITEDFREPLPDNVLEKFITGPSKRIRSALGILYLRANDKILTPEICKILAAGEIIHNASLLHDDVIDDAEKRRGNTTIANEFTPKISILAGDYLLLNATEKLRNLSADIQDKFRLCIKKMVEGEIKQYFLREQTPSIEKYIEICEDKTASLFAAVLESVAEISGLNSKTAYDFGKSFGICFQLKNDLDETSASNDTKNGIKTAKDIIGIENTLILSDNYKREMKKILDDMPVSRYKRELEDLVNKL